MIIKGNVEHTDILTKLGAETFYDSHWNSAPAKEVITYMDEVYNTNAIRSELANPLNIYHLLKHEDNVVGFSKMQLDKTIKDFGEERFSKMDQIYLSKSFHGMKLGANLLNLNIAYSKGQGQLGMWLVVWVGNTSAISFYEKFGFEIIRKAEFQLTKTHISPCYIMRLRYIV
jgi:ribosomal protein S18 acetylase RimI-like enzyme